MPGPVFQEDGKTRAGLMAVGQTSKEPGIPARGDPSPGQERQGLRVRAEGVSAGLVVPHADSRRSAPRRAAQGGPGAAGEHAHCRSQQQMQLRTRRQGSKVLVIKRW